MTKRMQTKAFSLIETIIYITLFSLIISSLFLIIQFAFNNSENVNSKILVREETNFLMAKFDWIFNGSFGVVVPSVSQPESQMLSLLKYGDIKTDVRLKEGKLEMKEDSSSDFVQISSSNFVVSDLYFKLIHSGDDKIGLEFGFRVDDLFSSSTFYFKQ